MISKNILPAFTLVEVIVSMTILSIIMVSVMVVFISGSNTANKIDIQRGMQENVKNIVESIAEDIRKNGIRECGTGEDDCMSQGLNDRLYVGSGSYFLGKKIGDAWVYTASQELCRNAGDTCFLIKNSNGVSSPLSNSQIAFDTVRFFYKKDEIGKVTLSFGIYPAFKKGVATSMIKDSSLLFQTTLADRLLKNEF